MSNATLALIIDNLDAVPEPIRSYYVQKGARYRLAVEGYDALARQWEERMRTLTAERDAALASERSALVDAGLDAALARAGANATARQLLPGTLKGRVLLEGNGPDRTLRFLKADEKTPLTGTGKHGSATWMDFMSDVRSAYPGLFIAP